MGLFRYYLRVFFRSNFAPVNPRVARKWEFNTTVIYFITAWTVFGLTAFGFAKASKEGTVGDARVIDPYELMKRFGTKKTFTIVDVAGVTVQTHQLSAEDLEETDEE